ncbi:hypothetical protein ACFQZ4_12525 [Catellatospora coxensis]
MVRIGTVRRPAASTVIVLSNWLYGPVSGSPPRSVRESVSVGSLSQYTASRRTRTCPVRPRAARPVTTTSTSPSSPPASRVTVRAAASQLATPSLAW